LRLCAFALKTGRGRGRAGRADFYASFIFLPSAEISRTRRAEAQRKAGALPKLILFWGWTTRALWRWNF
jgi:hypothetical protein